MNDCNCEEYLSFEPTERPGWRERLGIELNTIPPVSQMVKDIVEYYRIYQTLKSRDNLIEKRRLVLKKLLVRFLFNVQQEEDIGKKDIGSTEEIMLAVEEELKNESDHITDLDSNTGHLEFEQTPPSLSTFPSLEEEIPETHSHLNNVAKSEKETRNLYRGYKYLMEEIREVRSDTELTGKGEDYTDVVGLIDLQSCIIDTHRKLMDGLMDDRKSKPGQFSTQERGAEFKNEWYDYPTFEYTGYSEDAVITLLDKYNDMVHAVKKSEKDLEEKFMLYFKCASLFLFTFLTIHPFGDGNGRLARLLASYKLRIFSPFMTPIYNVFSSSSETDYVEALVSCRKGLKEFQFISSSNKARETTIVIMKRKPLDLCAMLIESNWAMWRRFLYEVGEGIRLYEWEKQNGENMN